MRNPAKWICILLTAHAFVTAASAQNFDLSWHTVDGGGAMFAVGGIFEVSGTVGQPDAGSPAQPMTGGSFSLIGGFWAAAQAPALPGDLDGDCDVDLADLATLLAHFGTASGATREMGDVDSDGDVDLADLAVLLAGFGQTC